MTAYTIDFIDVNFWRIEFSHSLALERTRQTAARRSALELGPKFHSREIRAFCLAPAAAPIVVAFVLLVREPHSLLTSGISQLVIVVVVSHVAGFILGYPLFLFFRRVVGSMAWSCLLAGLSAGTMAGVVLTTTLLSAVTSAPLSSNPSGVALFTGLGVVGGGGLGLAAGVVLLKLLSRDETWKNVA